MIELKDGVAHPTYINWRWSAKHQAWIVDGETGLPEPLAITEEKE